MTDFPDPNLVPELPLARLEDAYDGGFAISWRDEVESGMARYYQLPRSLRQYLLHGEVEDDTTATRIDAQLRAERLYRALLEAIDRDPSILGWALRDPDRESYFRDLEVLLRDLAGLARIPIELPPVTVAPENGGDREIHRRNLYWSSLLLTVGHDLLGQALDRTPYPIEVAVGFLDPEEEVAEFGLAISVGRQDIDESYLPPEPTRLEHLPATRRGNLNLPLLDGWRDQGGPFVLRRDPGMVESHGPPGYGGASASSFVRDSTSGLPLGILGCRHVLPSPSLGAGVPMQGHSAQRVVRIQHELDLAVVTSPVAVPSTPRTVQRWPAQWLPCSLNGSASSLTTRVIQVTNQWGVFTDPRTPVHVDLEHAGTHGDSGGEVVDLTSGGILGVYLGAVHNQGPARGRSVHIQQVESVMGVDLVE